MSKISYCSLEEAWGEAYKKNDENFNNDINKIDNIPDKNSGKYDYLNKMSQIERETVIDNMNKVERNTSPENNSIVEYNKYRLNPVNKVNKNDYDQNYTPFKESIEKKYLQDKLNFLENEFRKYKILFENNENYSNNTNINSEENIYESFKNSEDDKNENPYKSNDIIDLILLIIIGLIVIFVLNSIFSIGKTIGARSSKII